MSPLLAFASSLSERIKVNSITREIREGRLFWVKRRRRSAPLTLALANLFFRIAQCPVHALADSTEWQRWEVECFRRLHGEVFQSFAVGTSGVAAEDVPGASLAARLDAGTMTAAMAAAAGRELRRAHRTASPDDESWSHGDPHAANFLYDETQDRARLIDFELIHRSEIHAPDRQADDLLVFLQDIVGRVSSASWMAMSGAFLEAYDRPEIVARLAPRLILPRGIARLWWAVRTSYLPDAELANRFEMLRESLTAQRIPART